VDVRRGRRGQLPEERATAEARQQAVQHRNHGGLWLGEPIVATRAISAFDYMCVLAQAQVWTAAAALLRAGLASSVVSLSLSSVLC